MLRLTILCIGAAGLAACTPASGAHPRADRGDIAVPATGPRGIVASMPPGDSSFTPLRCRVVGPETVCDRSQ